AGSGNGGAGCRGTGAPVRSADGAIRSEDHGQDGTGGGLDGVQALPGDGLLNGLPRRSAWAGAEAVSTLGAAAVPDLRVVFLCYITKSTTKTPRRRGTAILSGRGLVDQPVMSVWQRIDATFCTNRLDL